MATTIFRARFPAAQPRPSDSTTLVAVDRVHVRVRQLSDSRSFLHNELSTNQQGLAVFRYLANDAAAAFLSRGVLCVRYVFAALSVPPYHQGDRELVC